ncbi:hypothetical protein [Mucilaginibacter sp.]|uniref:hypothetical protein n=1 Tax=Mucilaginibacter sp. TaxID=1882438 RepID=UPI003B00D055
MDQIQNGLNPEFLQQLLANPAAANAMHRQQLEALVQNYPACGIFRMLLAKAVQKPDAEIAEKALRSAAVYAANREVLFRLIHRPELLVAPKPDRFVGFDGSKTDHKTTTDTVFTEENLVDAPAAFAANYPVEVAAKEETNTVFINPKPETEADFSDEIPADEINNAAFIDLELEVVTADSDVAGAAPSAENDAVFIEGNLTGTDSQEKSEETDPQETTDAAFIEPKPAEIEDEEAVFTEDIPSAENVDASFTGENLEEAMAAENDFRAEDISQTFVNEDDEKLVFPEPTILAFEENFNQKPAGQEIDEEVFEEIMAIEDIKFEVVKEASPQIVPGSEPESLAPEVAVTPEITSEETPLNARDEAEKAMLSNIASIDYFSFNQKFGQNQTPETEKQLIEKGDDPLEKALAEPIKTDYQTENEADTVSKYHDDKMPYTFMWWLDRTRKEHDGNYQPYTKNVQNNTDLSVGPELHQQYIESIFHTKAPLKVPENVLPPIEELPVKKKEKQLIERFIIEEPHIHPPSMDKLDTENKAKKSSEDADILVTETLAKVYLDQMLYHKALDTYKKLLLKFPEKSVYFAAQLTEIEKKIN